MRAFLLTILLLLGSLIAINCQIGTGPILKPDENAYCQNIPAIYPLYKPPWFYDGEWQLSAFHTLWEGTTLSNCGYAKVQEVNSQTVFSTRRTFANSITETKTQISNNTFNNYLTGPTVWTIKGSDGIFQKASPPSSGFGRIILLGLSQDEATPSRTTYLTALYIYCGHLFESSPGGYPVIVEVGILTRNGTLPDYVLKHYEELIEKYQLIKNGQKLTFYSHENC